MYKYFDKNVLLQYGFASTLAYDTVYIIFIIKSILVESLRWLRDRLPDIIFCKQKWFCSILTGGRYYVARKFN